MPDRAERERLRASVGAALRRARGRNGMTQRALAALAGVDRRTVQRVEAGEIRPTTALLAALALALTVPPGWSPAGRRDRTAALLAEMEAAAGESLVVASARRARWRRRRQQRAHRAASRTALPVLKARHGMQAPGISAALAEAAAIVRAAGRLR